MTDQHLSQESKALEDDSNFISKKMREFSKKYSKQFIAIKDNRLIAIGKNFEGVMNKIKEKNIDPSFVLIEYVPGKEEIILY